MKKRTGLRILTIIMCLVMLSGNVLTAYAVNVGTNISAVYTIADMEEAQAALEILADEREIPALLYLQDIYALKEEPDCESGDIAYIASGQEVLITGVDEDDAKNIWYQVFYSYDEGEFWGYVQRENLAFSDERLHEWEEIYVKAPRTKMRTMRTGVSYTDVEQFPDSYQSFLRKLKQQHPNWTFVKMDTGLDWNYVVNLQSEGERSLVSRSTSAAWQDGYYSRSWSIASDAGIKYYLDPRNALTEVLVFQFEQLTYNPSYHSVSSTQKIAEGTFMDSEVPGTNTYYSEAFMQIAADKNISPLLMASRVRQEQGVSGSQMISGTYPGYEGLYNHYNIGASGNTETKEMITGLSKAREMGWTTPMLSLTGGSSVLSNNYIRKGQDTLYLQKFDVDGRYNGICWHQYMQNIAAPANEAKTTYNAYKNSGILGASFVFKIPVYRNMPSYACSQPGSTDKVTLNTSTIINLPIEKTAVLISYINGSQNSSVAMKYTSSNENVATVDSNGVVTGVGVGETTITCVRAENTDGATKATCKVTVVKADIPLDEVAIPEIEITYSDKQTLESVTKDMGDTFKGFTWIDGTVVPNVGNFGYSATYNPDQSKYNTLTLTIPVKVNKATVEKDTLSFPSDLTATAGDTLKSIALPNGYSWDNIEEQIPKKAGMYTFAASYCMNEVNYEVVEDIVLTVKVVCKSHEFGEWKGEHASCTKDGSLIRYCNICDESEKVTESAFGHEYNSKVTKEPTVKEAGVRTFTCLRCEDIYTVEIPALTAPHTHRYEEEITVEAACRETGIKTFLCDCQDAYTEVIPVLGHDMVDGECSRCDYVEPALPQHTHTYTLAGSTETCTKDGVATYICTCGDSYTEKTEALGHDMENDQCTRCDYKVEKPSDDSKPGTGDDVTAGGDKPGSGTDKPSDDDKDDSKDEENKPSDDSKPGTGDGTAGSDKPSDNKPDSGADNKPSDNNKPNSGTDNKPTDDSNKSDSNTNNGSVTQNPATQPPAQLQDGAGNPQSNEPAVAPNTNTNDRTAAQQNGTADNGAAADSSDGKADDNPDEMPEGPEPIKITMRHSTMLNKDKLAIVTENNRNLELVMADDVVWTLNLSNVSDIQKINVDMAVTMNHAEIPRAVLNTLPQDSPMILMSLSHEGPFDFEARLTIPVNKLNSGKYANLFYFNPDEEQMEFITDSIVSEDGTAEFLMAHASDYAIVVAEHSLNPNPPEEETKAEDAEVIVADTESDTNAEDVGGNVITTVLLWVMIIGAVVLAGIGIVFLVRYLKKEKPEEFYFDEEDDLPKEEHSKEKEPEVKVKAEKKSDSYYFDEEDESAGDTIK